MKISKGILAMSEADIIGYHHGRSNFDMRYAESMLKAQDLVLLSELKDRFPGSRVIEPYSWRFGFIPFGFSGNLDGPDHERLVLERNRLRVEKNYSASDSIRKRLESWGYEIFDDSSGTNWLTA